MAASKRPFSRDVEQYDDGGGDSRTKCVPIKRCRVDNCFSVTDHMYLEFPERLVDGITNVLMNSLCGRYCGVLLTLTPLIVLNSNAADETTPISFSNAYCSIGKYDSQYVFSSLFKNGLDILMDYVEQRKPPSNNEKKTVLDILLHFIFNLTNATDSQESPFEELNQLSETDRTIVLANHLFGKLSTSSHFVIDKHCKGKSLIKTTSCPCTKQSCKMTGMFGDTSIECLHASIISTGTSPGEELCEQNGIIFNCGSLIL